MEGKRRKRERAEDARIAQSWYGEAMARMKRLPALETILQRSPQGEQTPEDLLGVMTAIQAAGGSVTIELIEEI